MANKNNCMRVLTKEELQEIIDKHKHWLNKDCEGWESMKADLSYVDLKGADLKGVDLSYANLKGVNLRNTDLKDANLRNANLRYAKLNNAVLRSTCLNDADLSGACLIDADLCNAKLRNANISNAILRCAELRNADLSNVDLRCTNLSDAKNILSPIDYLKKNFEFTSDGMIAYKVFNGTYTPPEKWVIQSGSIITENCNPSRVDVYGCGINVAPLTWIKDNYEADIWKIWKVLIRWEWLAGVIVPYNTDGKIRCERCELLEIVER